MKGTFIIVPTYNEDLNVLKNTLTGIIALFRNVVIINDGGDDILDDLQSFPVHYVRHEINLGQGAALQTGMEYALERGAKKIGFFDADGQHNPHDLVRMAMMLDEEALDIILGSRFLQNNHRTAVPLFRRIVLKIATCINFIFTGLLLTDAHHGLKILNRKTAIKIEMKQNRQLHATELIHLIKAHKLKYKEIPAGVVYSPYSIKKGQKNRDFMKILSDLILSKFLK